MEKKYLISKPEILKLKKGDKNILQIKNISDKKFICRIRVNIQNIIKYNKDDFILDGYESKIINIEYFKDFKFENTNLRMKIFHKYLHMNEFNNCLIINIQTNSKSLIENKLNEFLKIDINNIKNFVNINQKEINTLNRLKKFDPKEKLIKYMKKIKEKNIINQKNDFKNYVEPTFKYNVKHIIIILIIILIYKLIF